jgi:hypothetical protein
MEKKWWINSKNMSSNDLNCLPVDDIREHIEDASCSCNPRVEIIGANLLIVHHAWDNRELFEEINQAIKEGIL